MKALTAVLCLLACNGAAHAQAVQLPSPGAGFTAQPGTFGPVAALRLNQGATLAQIRALPPSAVVETGSGRQVTAGQVQALSSVLQGLAGKTARLRAVDLALTRPTGAAQVNLTGAAQLPQVRAMAPNTIVQLRNGTRLTVGDIAKLENFSDRTGLRAKLAGRSAASGGAPVRQYAGMPALKVSGRAEVLALNLPDTTIIEGPNGARALLGEVKALLGNTASPSPAAPALPQGGVPGAATLPSSPAVR